MKKVFLAIFLICILFTQENMYSTNVVYECNRMTTDHAWYNPFTWFVDYDYVAGSLESGYVGSTLVIKVVIYCTGLGDYECPSCTMSLDPSDNKLNQPFLNSSTTLMENYVISQMINGIYNGNQSFNTIYNGTSIYRNVTWDGDSESTNINMHVIVP